MVSDNYDEKEYWSNRVKNYGFINTTATTLNTSDSQYIEPHIFKGAKVLDYGAGDGKLIQLFQQYKCIVTCIDIIPEFKQLFKQRYDEQKYTFQYEYIIIDPYKEYKSTKAPYDLVVSLAVFMHVRPDYIDWAINELKRLAGKDGKVMINNYENREVRYIPPSYNFNHDYLQILKRNGIEVKEDIYNNNISFIRY